MLNLWIKSRIHEYAAMPAYIKISINKCIWNGVKEKHVRKNAEIRSAVKAEN